MMDVIERPHAPLSPVPPRRRTGIALVYTAVLMMVLVGFASFAVDWGRVEMVKTELMRAADAAARGAASQLPNGVTAVQNAAVLWGGDNTADQTPVVIDPNNDVEFGTWNTASRTFTVLTGASRTSANAVRITACRTAARGTATSLYFGSLIGKSSCDVSVQCIAMLIGAATQTYTVPATSDLWLAGMPAGSTASYGDTTANASPKLALSVTPGATLVFSNTSGTCSNATTGPRSISGAQGDYTWINSHNYQVPDNEPAVQNGVGNIYAPVNSLLGLFLTNSAPNTRSPPTDYLDYTTQAARDVTPMNNIQLQQPFYIGTGTNSSGATMKFLVPAGATRLYLGTMDGYTWNDDSGSFTVTVTEVGLVQSVK